MTPATAVGASVRVVSVNVGRPARLGMRQGRVVYSAIRKLPVTQDALRLEGMNLEGDRQSDLRVHGGSDKALFAYPVEHLRAWSAELGPPEAFAPGSIGENLTVEGWDEETVHIGDVWGWGEARVQVCQPRQPCFKLQMRTGSPIIVRLFEQRGHCGWYLRVLEGGEVPTRRPLDVRLVERAGGLAVRTAQRLATGPPDAAGLAAAIANPALASGWRRTLQRRQATLDTPAP